MTQVGPWYSIKEPVYHNNNKCGPGNRVINKIAGMGGKKLCKDCQALNKAGK